MDIIYETIPYGALPCFDIDEDTKCYSITDLNNNELILLKHHKRVFVPVFQQTMTREYILSFVERNNLFQKSSVIDKFNKDNTNGLIIPNLDNIIKLFEKANCNELKIIIKGESFMAITINHGISCTWDREVGFLGMCGN